MCQLHFHLVVYKSGRSDAIRVCVCYQRVSHHISGEVGAVAMITSWSVCLFVCHTGFHGIILLKTGELCEMPSATAVSMEISSMCK